MLPEVSVILPTSAVTSRGQSLLRAVMSVLNQEDCRPSPLIVINGSQRDQGLVRELSGDPRLRVTILDETGLPRAYLAGMDLVDSPWVAELDDDDVLTPGAFSQRLDALSQAPDHDVVITNGFRRFGDRKVLHIGDMDSIRRDPLAALRRGNWLLPGSWLAKASSVPRGFFELMPMYRETTYLALRFAMDCRPIFLDEPTVEVHTDTVGSASKSREYVLAGAAAMEALLKLDLPPAVRSWIRRGRAGALHEGSELLLEEGSMREAWNWHIRSLLELGGARHVTFTRHLFFKGFRRLSGRATDGTNPRSR